MSRSPAPAPVVLDLDYFDHHKTETVGAAGRDLHLRSIAHANRFWTDGFVPHAKAISLAKLSLTAPGSLVEPSVTEALQLIDLLVDAGLWEHADSGFDIHDYAVYQETRESLERRRERWRARKRKSRVGHANVTPSDQMVSGSLSVSEGQTDLTNTASPETASGPVTWQSVHEFLQGSDEMTPAVIHSLGRTFGFREAPLADAWRALELRREKQPRLVSEARYFVRVLVDARDSGRFAA